MNQLLSLLAFCALDVVGHASTTFPNFTAAAPATQRVAISANVVNGEMAELGIIRNTSPQAKYLHVQLGFHYAIFARNHASTPVSGYQFGAGFTYHFGAGANDGSDGAQLCSGVCGGALAATSGEAVEPPLYPTHVMGFQPGSDWHALPVQFECSEQVFGPFYGDVPVRVAMYGNMATWGAWQYGESGHPGYECHLLYSEVTIFGTLQNTP